MAVPYTFATATSSIPLSQLDANFATAITLGNTAVYLGNTTTSIGNLTLTNTTISSVAVTFPNSYLANSSVTIGSTNVSLGGTATTLANLTLSNVTISSGTSNVTQNLANVTGTLAVANGGTGLTSLTTGYIPYGNGTSAFSSSSNLTFSGSTLTVSGTASVLNLNSSSYSQVVSAQSLYLDAGSTGAIYIRPNGSTQAAVFSSAGYLGIGTSSPSATLEVAGAMKVSATNAIATLASSGSYGYIALTNNGGATKTATIVSNAGGTLDLEATQHTFSNYDGTVVKMTLDNSGNLGIGTTSPSIVGPYASVVDIRGTTTDQNYGGALRLASNNGTTTNSYLLNTSVGLYIYNTKAGAIIFGTNNTEAARIDSSGNLLVGTTSFGSSNTNSILIQPAGGAGYWQHASGTASGQTYHQFNYNATNIGSITQSGTTAVLYNVTSDQRLKTNIVDAPAGNINDIKVRSFDWIADNSHQKYGMVAQELLEVAPYAVHQPTNPDEMMGIDYSKLVPMMIREIQDLKQRIATLENK